MTCDLVGPQESVLFTEAGFPPEMQAVVLNPTSIEQSILRASLLPGLLKVVKDNQAVQCNDIAGFEIGKIHYKAQENYQEQSMMALVLSGKNSPGHFLNKSREVDFYDLKGILENIFSELGIDAVQYRKSAFQFLHPGRQASVAIRDLQIGIIGEIHPGLLKERDIKGPIYFAEINLHDLSRCVKKEFRFHELPLYPSSERDVTITIDLAQSVDSILQNIKNVASPYLEECKVIDLYKSEKLGKDKGNLTLRFIYRNKEGTLSQEIVDKEHETLVKKGLTV